MSATAAVLLTADDGEGQTFLLADPAQLNRKMMIISDPDNGNVHMVDREQFLAGGYSVTVESSDAPTENPGKRRRFRKGR
jgi:hypothetical protein